MKYKVKYRIGVILFYIFRIFPIKKNKIVISSYDGKGFGDNGKYIVKELLEQKKYDIVWLLNGKKEFFPDGVRTVNIRSLKSIYEQCTAKVWIDNKRKPGYVRKRKNQFYIMTWHGGITLKKVEKDAEKALKDTYVRAAINDSKMIDVILSGAKWDTDLYKKSFWYNGKILEVGYPRQDILFQHDEKMKGKIKNRLNINEEKVVLYAPTFRKELNNMDVSVYKMDWNKVLSALTKKFGGEWKGLIRLHPNVSMLADDLNLPDHVLNVTRYDDMQELLAISDCVITDYSSALLEFAITEKMGFIYATDYDKYKNDRDLYFSMDQLPFSIAFNNDELVNNIMEFNSEEYLQRNKAFYCKCGLFKGGNASKKVSNLIGRITA